MSFPSVRRALVFCAEMMSSASSAPCPMGIEPGDGGKGFTRDERIGTAVQVLRALPDDVTTRTVLLDWAIRDGEPSREWWENMAESFGLRDDLAAMEYMGVLVDNVERRLREQGLLRSSKERKMDGIVRTWPAIAKYMGFGVTTVKRWHREAGMPVHASGGCTVWARKEALAAWFERRSERGSRAVG